MTDINNSLIAKEPSSFHRLLTNSVWNFLGQGVGLLVAIVAIPILIKQLGLNSFGLFTICLTLIGYSGLLDLGISRAVTAAVSQCVHRDDRKAATDIASTALAILGSIGLGISLLLILFAESIVSVLNMTSESTPYDAHYSIYVLAATVPIVLLASALRGALEGLQEFKSVNLIMMPINVMMFAFPATLSFFTSSVWILVVSLTFTRSISLLIFYVFCSTRFSDLGVNRVCMSQAKALLTYGGWITVSNIVSPIMNNLDRLFISAQLSPSAVSLHVTSFELTTKALMPAGAVANASFPEFAKQQTSRLQQDKNIRYFWRAMLLTTFASLLPSLFIFSFAKEILTAWISIDFANGPSTEIMKLLALSIIANGAAYIPFAFIQGIGRADICAKFHLFELLLFIPALMMALQSFGVIGAAMVALARTVLDFVLLFSYSLRKLA